MPKAVHTKNVQVALAQGLSELKVISPPQKISKLTDLANVVSGVASVVSQAGMTEATVPLSFVDGVPILVLRSAGSGLARCSVCRPDQQLQGHHVEERAHGLAEVVRFICISLFHIFISFIVLSCFKIKRAKPIICFFDVFFEVVQQYLASSGAAFVDADCGLCNSSR